MSGLKYIPSCLHLAKNYLEEYCFNKDRDCISVLSIWPFHVVALILVPVGAILWHFVLVLISGILRVLFELPWEYLVARKGFCHAWELPLEIIAHHDAWTQSFCGFAFFTDAFLERTSHRHSNAETVDHSDSGNNEQASATTYWDRFASQSVQTTAALLDRGFISLEDLETMEPCVIQSIPAVAVLQVLTDTVNDKDLENGDLKWSIDGTICKQTQRPARDGILQHLWPMVRDLKRTLQVNQTTGLLDDENLQVLKAMLCANGETENEECQRILQNQQASNGGKTSLHVLNNSIRTKINRLVLAILRVKPYQDRMTSVFTHKYYRGSDDNDVESNTSTVQSGCRHPSANPATPPPPEPVDVPDPNVEPFDQLERNN